MKGYRRDTEGIQKEYRRDTEGIQKGYRRTDNTMPKKKKKDIMTASDLQNTTQNKY
jgi:hypothetical protein